MAKTTARTRVLTLSTSTLGGAILMTLVSMALGDKAPWFIERLSASVSDIQSISLNVNEIFVKKSVTEIDPQKYYVDARSQFFLSKPEKDAWGVETANPGHVLDAISVAYVPFFRFSLSMYSSMFNLEKPRRDDVTTTTFASTKSAYSIAFTDSTSIAGYPLTLNPFEDLDFVKASLRAAAVGLQQSQVEIAEMLDESTPKGREFLELARKNMEQQGRTMIIKNWPTEQRFSDNFSVTTFRVGLLSRSTMFRLLVKDNKPGIFTILNFLIFCNPELMLANIKHLEINKNNDAVLINGSIPITNIIANGSAIHSCQLVRFVLITMKEETIYVTSMRYLYGIGSSSDDSDELKSLFASFRVIQ